MDYKILRRKQLQELCKKHNIACNQSNVDIATTLNSMNLEVDYNGLYRNQLQALCKAKKISGKLSNARMAEELTKALKDKGIEGHRGLEEECIPQEENIKMTLEVANDVASRLSQHLSDFNRDKGTIHEDSKQMNSLKEEIERRSTKRKHIIGEKSQCLTQNEFLKETYKSFKESQGKSLQQKVAEILQEVEVVDDELHEAEEFYRESQNTLEGFKGSCRVYCRVRPLDTEKGECLKSAVEYPTSAELQGCGIQLIQRQGGVKHFKFDKVFGPDITQENIFLEVSPMVKSVMDGHKVCIFAYGQSGSGKTYTMLGRCDDDYHKGIVPRTLERIFSLSQDRRTQNWNVKMQASVLEIYNDTIKDLARVNYRDARKQHIVKHELKKDANGNFFVSNLTLVEVTTWKEVSRLLKRAEKNRVVGKTAMNEQSSRSHCIFTLRIDCFHESTGHEVHGVLNLVDLAGSERGERVEETKAINTSLAVLRRVFKAIDNNDNSVPYRESKLTHLLQPWLDANSKVLMIVNISPNPRSVEDSIRSLEFAAGVNTCSMQRSLEYAAGVNTCSMQAPSENLSREKRKKGSCNG